MALTAGRGYGKLIRLLAMVPVGVVAPVLLMTWVMVPWKSSGTVSRSWNRTPVTAVPRRHGSC